MFQQVLLCFTGFCAGIIVAGGVSGLLIGLSIVPVMQASPTQPITFFYMKICHFWEPLPEPSLPSFRSGSHWDLFSWLSAEYSSEFSWVAGSWHWQKLQKSFPFSPDA